MSAPISELQQRLDRHPGDWETRLSLADALIIEGKADMAVMVVSLAPAPPETAPHLRRAGRHLLPIHPADALKFATQLMLADEMDAEAALLAGEACRELEDADEAEKHCLVAVELDPTLEPRAAALKESIAGNTTSFVTKDTVPINVQLLKRQHSLPPPPSVVEVTEEEDDGEAMAVAILVPEPKYVNGKAAH